MNVILGSNFDVRGKCFDVVDIRLGRIDTHGTRQRAFYAEVLGV